MACVTIEFHDMRELGLHHICSCQVKKCDMACLDEEKCLDDEEKYLNDTIIDFQLRWLR